MSFPACAMAPEAKSYTIGYMIRGYHVYKNVWLSYIGKVLDGCLDERNSEGPFGSEGTSAKQNWNVYSLEVLVKRHRLIKSQDMGLWHMQQGLSWNEGISVTVELKSVGPQHLAEFAKIGPHR